MCYLFDLYRAGASAEAARVPEPEASAAVPAVRMLPPIDESEPVAPDVEGLRQQMARLQPRGPLALPGAAPLETKKKRSTSGSFVATAPVLCPLLRSCLIMRHLN